MRLAQVRYFSINSIGVQKPSQIKLKTAMSKVKRAWERLTDDEKKSAKEELILFFENERDQKIGIIAAEEIINFFLQTVGTKLYQQGITDAKKAVDNRIEELKYDLDDLIEI